MRLFDTANGSIACTFPRRESGILCCDAFTPAPGSGAIARVVAGGGGGRLLAENALSLWRVEEGLGGAKLGDLEMAEVCEEACEEDAEDAEAAEPPKAAEAASGSAALLSPVGLYPGAASMDQETLPLAAGKTFTPQEKIVDTELFRPIEGVATGSAADGKRRRKVR